MSSVFSHIAIPAKDFERAFAFYSALTDGRLTRNPSVPFPMAYFNVADGEPGGHLFQLPGFIPGADGPIVYFELAPDLRDTLAKVEAAGGKTLMAKTALGPGRGYWALFLDTEGNRLALHSAE